MTNTNDIIAREREVRSAFSPSAPVTKRDLFAGRTEQFVQLLDAVEEPGQHVVIYGERGVGKTSFAAVCADLVLASVIKVNCQSDDSFSTVWRKVLTKLTVTTTMQSFGFGMHGAKATDTTTAAAMLREVADLTPDHIEILLTAVGAERKLVIMMDEFDRLESSVHRMMADTLKTLSDQAVNVTLVIVGVADDVDGLISEHASIERALVQISMPRMSRSELAEIVTKGLATVDMTVTSAALDGIAGLSQGLPHYTHLLAQLSGAAAAIGQVDVVDDTHLQTAIRSAMTKAQESIHNAYDTATFSARENMYKQVLLACAAAPVDDRGFFSASAVRIPLRFVVGKTYEIAQFARHLSKFSNERGPVLKKVGSDRAFRYRFVNPLMQPYVLMRGIRDGMITAAQIRHLADTSGPRADEQT